MNGTIYQQKNSQVGWWLIVGVLMIMIQVVLGGITRLTGSGLSITEWAPLLKGMLPPMNETEWQEAFDKYKQIGQYKFINFDFTLEDFKFIFFWEWLHRLWARLIGFVFIIPFIYFIIKGRIKRDMVVPMVILFLLGILQAVIGWIMVKSGLNENDVSVSHIRLSVHFLAAFFLLSYTFWFALSLLVPPGERVVAPAIARLTIFVIIVLTIQLMYGAFMAGLKAGAAAPTWPHINNQWWPAGINQSNGTTNIISNPIAVQFIHRLLAYSLVVLIIYWFIRISKIYGKTWLSRGRVLPLVLVVLQVILGIVTVIQSPVPSQLLWWGISHQFVAMLLLLSLIATLYLVNQRMT